MFSKPTIALRTIIFALIGSIYWIDWSPWRERNPPVSTDQLYSQNMLYFCLYRWEWEMKENARDLRNVHVYMIHRTECTIHRLHGINTDILYGLFCFETIPRINSIPDRIYLRHSPHTFPAIKRGILPISTPNLGHFLFVYWTIRQPGDLACTGEISRPPGRDKLRPRSRWPAKRLGRRSMSDTQRNFCVHGNHCYT